jgi:hypothetical protein
MIPAEQRRTHDDGYQRPLSRLGTQILNFRFRDAAAHAAPRARANRDNPVVIPTPKWDAWSA